MVTVPGSQVLVPFPAPSTTVRKPGFAEFDVCGVVQPAGTTIESIEPEANVVPFGALTLSLLKSNVRVNPESPDPTDVGKTVFVPSPSFAANAVPADPKRMLELIKSAVSERVRVLVDILTNELIYI